METRRHTSYERVGAALINFVIFNGEVNEKYPFKKYIEEITSSELGQYKTPCMDGTPGPTGLHITSKGPFGEAGLSFTEKEEIDYLLSSYGVKNAEDLVGKKIKTYNVGLTLAGFEPVTKELKMKQKLVN